MPLPKLLTTAETAEYLGRSSAWVEAAARAKDLPGRKVGRQWRFTEADLEAYLDASHAAQSQPRTRRRRAS